MSDNCAGREARFSITASKVFNFEVESDVARVKVFAPNEGEISITGTDDDGTQYNDAMKLTIIDGGRILKFVGSDTLYRKCPG